MALLVYMLTAFTPVIEVKLGVGAVETGFQVFSRCPSPLDVPTEHGVKSGFCFDFFQLP